MEDINLHTILLIHIDLILELIVQYKKLFPHVKEATNNEGESIPHTGVTQVPLVPQTF